MSAIVDAIRDLIDAIDLQTIALERTDLRRARREYSARQFIGEQVALDARAAEIRARRKVRRQ